MQRKQANIQTLVQELSAIRASPREPPKEPKRIPVKSEEVASTSTKQKRHDPTVIKEFMEVKKKRRKLDMKQRLENEEQLRLDRQRKLKRLEDFRMKQRSHYGSRLSKKPLQETKDVQMENVCEDTPKEIKSSEPHLAEISFLETKFPVLSATGRVSSADSESISELHLMKPEEVADTDMQEQTVEYKPEIGKEKERNYNHAGNNEHEAKEVIESHKSGPSTRTPDILSENAVIAREVEFIETHKSGPSTTTPDILSENAMIAPKVSATSSKGLETEKRSQFSSKIKEISQNLLNFNSRLRKALDSDTESSFDTSSYVELPTDEAADQDESMEENGGIGDLAELFLPIEVKVQSVDPPVEYQATRDSQFSSREIYGHVSAESTKMLIPPLSTAQNKKQELCSPAKIDSAIGESPATGIGSLAGVSHLIEEANARNHAAQVIQYFWRHYRFRKEYAVPRHDRVIIDSPPASIFDLDSLEDLHTEAGDDEHFTNLITSVLDIPENEDSFSVINVMSRKFSLSDEKGKGDKFAESELGNVGQGKNITSDGLQNEGNSPGESSKGDYKKVKDPESHYDMNTIKPERSQNALPVNKIKVVEKIQQHSPHPAPDLAYSEYSQDFDCEEGASESADEGHSVGSLQESNSHSKSPCSSESSSDEDSEESTSSSSSECTDERQSAFDSSGMIFTFSLTMKSARNLYTLPENSRNSK